MDRQDTFYRFMSLPYDLRHYVYVLATPSRVVRVDEGPINVKEKNSWSEEEYDSYFEYAFEKFYSQMLDGPPNFNRKLHPDLASFAHNWRDRIPWSSRRCEQKRLEAYGFSSSRPAYQPWQASADVPSIPADWLIDFPELAFELTREACLYSTAKIPALLHVCVESRQALMRWGYRLSFATRTAGPRTWFHPHRDRLYIPFTANSFPRGPPHWGRDGQMPVRYPCIEPGVLLSGCHWNIGQYSVQDLRQVKYVVLGRGADIGDNDDLAHNLQNILPLLSSLRELYLEDWSADYIADWFEGTQNSDIPKFESSVACIPVEDIDPIGCFYWTCDGDPYQVWPDVLRSTGYNNHHFNRYKEAHSDPYHQAKASALEVKLRLWQSRCIFAGDQKPRIPAIRHVHLCPEALAESFMANRHRFWKAFQSLTSAFIRQPKFRTTFSAVNDFPRPFQTHWDDIQGMGMEWPEFFDSVQRRGSDSFPPEGSPYMYVPKAMLQAWYLDRFVIPEPQSKIL